MELKVCKDKLAARDKLLQVQYVSKLLFFNCSVFLIFKQKATVVQLHSQELGTDQGGDVVLEAAVSAWGRLEAVFQPVSPWLCLGDHLLWLGSALDFLPRPRLGLIIFGSARLCICLGSVSKVPTLYHCCVTMKFVGWFKFTSTLVFYTTVSANTARRELECVILVIFCMEAKR